MSFEKIFKVLETYKGAAPFETAPDGALYGKVCEVCELEGVARLQVMNGAPMLRLPSTLESIKYDPFFLRQGSVYRITLHVRMDPGARGGCDVGVALWSALRSSMILLSSEVLEDGLIVLFVTPVFRTEVVVGFPVALLSVNELSGRVVESNDAKPKKVVKKTGVEAQGGYQ